MYFSAGWWRNDDEEGVRPSRFPWLRAGGTGGRSFRALRFSGYIVAGGKVEYHWRPPLAARFQRVHGHTLGREGSEGSPFGRTGGAADAAGWDPSRGNDSLHFVRRCAPTSTAVTDSLDFQVADAPLQIQFA